MATQSGPVRSRASPRNKARSPRSSMGRLSTTPTGSRRARGRATLVVTWARLREARSRATEVRISARARPTAKARPTATATVRAKALAIIKTTPRPRPTAKAMVKATGTPTARAKANARATATAIPATETATPTDTRSRSRYQGGASTREPLPGALSLSRALLTTRPDRPNWMTPDVAILDTIGEPVANVPRLQAANPGDVVAAFRSASTLATPSRARARRRCVVEEQGCTKGV